MQGITKVAFAKVAFAAAAAAAVARCVHQHLGCLCDALILVCVCVEMR